MNDVLIARTITAHIDDSPRDTFMEYLRCIHCMITDSDMAVQVLTLLYHDAANHQGPQCCDDGEHTQLLLDACNIVIKNHEVPVIMFDDGCIETGEFAGIYALPLATCLLDSSWDFPSYVLALGLGHLFPDEEPTMYPSYDDALILANALNFDDDDGRDEFAALMPTGWDT